MKIVSLILARGGSKGIPKKNIYPIAGKPLLYYSLNAAMNSEVNEVWVSTDCSEIKKIALSYKAKVLDRPDEISTDIAQSEDALMHFAKNIDFDILVFIQPTSPLILSMDINNGLELLRNKKYDSVFSV
jgi:N-acylneuraminate cytidylyltransferase